MMKILQNKSILLSLSPESQQAILLFCVSVCALIILDDFIRISVMLTELSIFHSDNKLEATLWIV
jgi:hypothetical protein